MNGWPKTGHSSGGRGMRERPTGLGVAKKKPKGDGKKGRFSLPIVCARKKRKSGGVVFCSGGV